MRILARRHYPHIHGHCRSDFSGGLNRTAQPTRATQRPLAGAAQRTHAISVRTAHRRSSLLFSVAGTNMLGTMHFCGGASRELAR